MRKLPVACPNCSYQQIIAIRKLDEQHECDECGKPFYIDHGGKCVKGLVPAGPRDNSLTFIHTSGSRSVSRASGVRIPRGAVGLTIGLGTLLAAWMVARAINNAATPLPESLTDRADYAAAAFARGDLEAILAVTDSSTSIAAQRWFETKRVGSWAIWRSGPPIVTTTTLFKREKTRSAGTVSTMVFPSADTAGDGDNAGAPRFELVLFWNLGDDNFWRIDGTDTAREASRGR